MSAPGIPQDDRTTVVESSDGKGWLVSRWDYEAQLLVYLDNSRVPGGPAFWSATPYLYPSERDAQDALMFFEAG